MAIDSFSEHIYLACWQAVTYVGGPGGGFSSRKKIRIKKSNHQRKKKDKKKRGVRIPPLPAGPLPCWHENHLSNMLMKQRGPWSEYI